jgi:hypothetical protein
VAAAAAADRAAPNDCPAELTEVAETDAEVRDLALENVTWR